MNRHDHMDIEKVQLSREFPHGSGVAKTSILEIGLQAAIIF